MIKKHEIIKVASKSNLSPQVIEKDYVIGWVLAGITGIEIPTEKLKFEIYKNPRNTLSCEGKIYYRGPLSPNFRNKTPRIKLDLTSDEITVAPTIVNKVKHDYLDQPKKGIHIQCYSYEEVFAEKIRALAERTRPRDLYDIISSYSLPESYKLANKVRDILEKKCAFKSIQLPTYETLSIRKDLCSTGWEDQLSHQLQTLPPFDFFWNELKEFFKWLYAKKHNKVFSEA